MWQLLESVTSGALQAWTLQPLDHKNYVVVIFKNLIQLSTQLGVCDKHNIVRGFLELYSTAHA